MSVMAIWNADDICRVRLCQASDCPDDAITGSACCARHDRQARNGTRITLHTTQQKPPSLPCRGPCQRWLPDASYPPATTQPVGGPRTDRRGRHTICIECQVKGHVRDFNHREPT